MVHATSPSNAHRRPPAKPRTRPIFPFLRLPRETRNSIYELCLIDTPRWRRHHRNDCDMLLQHIPHELELRQAMACVRAAHARSFKVRQGSYKHHPQQQEQEHVNQHPSSSRPDPSQLKIQNTTSDALDWMYLHKAQCFCLKRRGLNLLQSNRQVHNEAATLFWSRNAFLLRGVFKDGLPTDHDELAPLQSGHLRMLRELHLLHTDEAHNEWKAWIIRLRVWVEKLRPGYGRPARYLPVVASLGPPKPWCMWYSVKRTRAATGMLCRGSARRQISEGGYGQRQAQGRREQQGSHVEDDIATRTWHNDLTLARVGVHATEANRFVLLGRWVS